MPSHLFLLPRLAAVRFVGSLCLTAPLLLVGCGGGSAGGESVIRLVDRFDSKMIEGSPKSLPAAPAARWDFSSAAKPGGGDAAATLGWKAGPGVTGLRVVEGRLTGRSTSGFPVIYVARPQGVDPNDVLYSLDLRMRASDGANLSANGLRSEGLDLKQAIAMTDTFPWPLTTPLRAGEDFQNVSIQPALPLSLQAIETLAIRPVDVAGASFEIESVQLVSQREHRESIPSGVGWNGLAGIYRETIVSRSPEKLRMEVDIPADAWLDLNLGTVDYDPIRFKVAALSNGGEETLLERTLTTPHRWEPVRVDLSRYSGQATLLFSLDVEEEHRLGFWGSPVIRRRSASPVSQQASAVPLGNGEPPRGVILIMCDTLRKDHLNAYGYQRETAPNLARMASQGALFLDNVSQATWTKVSTPSIMTSLYPSSHRVKDFADRLSPAATTLAEVYRQAGYATVAYSSVLFTGKFTNLHQGFEELNESSSVQDERYPAETARPFVDRAADWIERHQQTPFFMFLHVFDPHDPFEPRPPYGTLWADAGKKEEHERQREKVSKVIEDPLMKAFHMPNRAELERAGIDPQEYVGYDRDWYDGSIRGMDAEIGRLIGRLRQMGLEEKTQIAFVSDHGEEFIEHGKMFHGQTVYGELAGVPLLFYRPGTVPAGVKISETVRNIDLMPTLLELSGLPSPAGIQGQSLVPLIAAARTRGQGGAGGSLAEAAEALGWKRQPAVTEKAKTLQAGGPPPRDTESHGIVHDGWKLVHHSIRSDGGPEFELYNHRDDPLDLRDVAGEHPEIVERLKERLDDWRKMVAAAQLPESMSSENLSPEELKRLRSLGYIK